MDTSIFLTLVKLCFQSYHQICVMEKSKKHGYYTYRKDLTEKARYLRKNSTRSEIMLWNCLKRDALGVDFHRQKPIDCFILDFYCPELKLGIELDGITHQQENVKRRDRIKEARMNELGITILRFEDVEVWGELDRVVEEIKKWVEESKLKLISDN